MGRGKAYTQEEKKEIYEAYKEGMSVEQIVKYIAKTRPQKSVKQLIKDIENEEKAQSKSVSNITSEQSLIVAELKRMNDLKLKEIDLLNSLWVSCRNIAINTKNLSDELNKGSE